MRIVHTEADGGEGGQPLRIISESIGLIQRGHQITILCPEEAPLYTLAHKEGLNVIAMPLKHKKLYNLILLRRWINKNYVSIDIINSHNSDDTWLVALTNLTLPNPVPLVRTRHASGTPRNNCATRWLFCKACAHIVNTGEVLRKQVVSIGVPTEKTTSVPSGIDIRRFYPRNKKQSRIHCGLSINDFWIGVVSYLRPNKGHSILLRALARINNSHIKLAIVGEGSYKEKLKKEIDALRLHHRVVMVGHQNSPEYWFPAFDIALSPSHDMEGLPQGVLQSLASRIATITTDAGSAADAVIDGQTGILIPQHDEIALYKAIMNLYNNKVLRKKIAHQGYTYFLTHFTHEHMLEAMEKIFINVVRYYKSR